jgi:hypothetical protein
MADNTGKPYEFLTQVIFQWILNQSEVRNIVVQHDVKLPGKGRNSHQIDVYWRFALNGLEYETIVEVKDWKDPVDQGELFEFKTVLEDLPGQPKGIFVSRGGYQQGARDFAETHGILLYELRESDYLPPVSIPVTGWARYGIVPMPVQGVLRKHDESVPKVSGTFGFVWDIFSPEYSKVQFEPSMTWLQQEYPTVDFSRFGSPYLPTTHLYKIEFYNEEKVSIGNLADLFRGIAQAVNSEGLAFKQVRHVFEPPILIRTDTLAVPYVKMDAVSMDVKIEHRQEVRRGQKPDFTEWILRDLKSGKTEWFLATPAVRASLPSKS